MDGEDDGWERSAAAWIDVQGEHGDFGRQFVLDPVMMARIEGRGFRSALDVGCGEGRFCRVLRRIGIHATGLDPTRRLLDHARRRDPDGNYVLGRAEALPFPDDRFDLVVSYLSLIDIPDIRRAIPEMARVLAPGGCLLIANLNGIATAGSETGWVRGLEGERLHYPVDRYLEERAIRSRWAGIDILNWHRPLGTYMSLLLAEDLALTYFEEPPPVGGDPERADRYRRVPWFLVMEWRKPSQPRVPAAPGEGSTVPADAGRREA